MTMLASVQAGFAQAQVPDTFLAEPKPVRVGLNLGRDADPFIIGIDGRNAATAQVRLAPPVIGPLLSVEGGVSTQAATRKPVELRANSCSGDLPAGRSCAISLALPSDIGAGRYTIDVMLPGADGGQSTRTIPIHVRASPWLAGLVIAIGVALGALVTDWRTAARPVTNRRIEAADLRTRLAKVAGSSTQRPVGMRARELERDLRALDAEIVAGKDIAQKLADGEKRLLLLQQSELLLNAAARPKGEAADIFRTLARRLTGALEAVEWQDAEVEKAGKALGAELVGFQRLHEAAAEMDMLTLRFADGVSRSRSVERIRTAWSLATELRARAFDRIVGVKEGATAETAARAAALEAATAELSGMTVDIAAAVLDELRKAIAAELAQTPPPSSSRKQELEALDAEAKSLAASTLDGKAKLGSAVELHRSFKTRPPDVESVAPPSGVPAVVSADSDLKFELPVSAFQLAAGASVADLQRSVRRWNWITSLVALAGIAAVGVLVLWVPNTAWGTVQDVILALLGGAGTRLAIGTIATPGGAQS